MYTYAKKSLLLGLTLLPFLAFSQAEQVFNEIRFHEPLVTVQEKLEEISQTVELIAPKETSFPLAKLKEAHLIASKIQTKDGTINRAVFTFSDNQLTNIEAQGNVIKVLMGSEQDSLGTYMDYLVNFKKGMLGKTGSDKVWILSEEALHINLFIWENPYLNSVHSSVPKYSSSAQIPDFLQMGADLEVLRPLLEANSDIVYEEKLDGSDPNAQVQLNCFGIEYAGFPRKVEARFGDNKLNMVWILTGKGDEDRLRKKLTKIYGEPVFKNEAWEIFNDWTIGLRKDKPEVLIMTKALGQFYKKEYFEQ